MLSELSFVAVLLLSGQIPSLSGIDVTVVVDSGGGSGSGGARRCYL